MTQAELVAYVRAQGAVNVPMVQRRFAVSRAVALYALQEAHTAGLLFKGSESECWSTTAPARRRRRG
jgi:hypothetical protein